MKRIVVMAGLSCALNGSAWAAPEEIQVYLDELNAPGQFGLDLHSNYVMAGAGAAAYSGAQPALHVFRLTPEFSYGLTANLELGAYVLTSTSKSSNADVDGEKLRLKFIASKEDGQAYFWGANLEVGRVTHRIDQNPWNAELKGILGYRKDRWLIAVNPNIDWKVSGLAPAPTTAEVDTKLAYDLGHDYKVGLESYNALGPLRHLGHLADQSQTLFAVVEASVQGWDFNVGLGRGMNHAGDRWLLKTIISVPL